jgi:hypothetical protein
MTFARVHAAQALFTVATILTMLSCARASHGAAPPQKSQALPSAFPLDGVCEASGMLATETKPGNATLLVADDEESAHLFRFTWGAEGVRAAGTLELPRRARPSDIEALTRAPGTLFVVGSHSVSKKGRLAKRARVVELEHSHAGAKDESVRLLRDRQHADWLALAQGDVQRCGALFVEGARAAMPALCPALAINVEGAFVDAERRLWLGLRAPLVEGRATLLRVRDEGPGFDRSAFVDVGGHGVRDLALDEGTLFLLTGPTSDRAEPGRLYAIESTRVTTGGRSAAGELPLVLPERSEGLAVTSTHFLVVTDGERASADACKTPSTLHVYSRSR